MTLGTACVTHGGIYMKREESAELFMHESRLYKALRKLVEKSGCDKLKTPFLNGFPYID